MGTIFEPDENDVLIVVDLQYDFCPGGALEVPDGDAVIPVINRLARRMPHMIVAQDWHPAGHQSFASSHPGKAAFDTVTMPYGEQILWPDHCVQGTRGAELHAELDVDPAELVIRKGFRGGIDSYSAFFENDKSTETGLAGYLRERGAGRLVMAGLALDFCVRYSAEDARRLGFEVVVVEDGCRAIDMAGSLAATLASFAELGVELRASDAIGAAA